MMFLTVRRVGTLQVARPRIGFQNKFSLSEKGEEKWKQLRMVFVMYCTVQYYTVLGQSFYQLTSHSFFPFNPLLAVIVFICLIFRAAALMQQRITVIYRQEQEKGRNTVEGRDLLQHLLGILPYASDLQPPYSTTRYTIVSLQCI